MNPYSNFLRSKTILFSEHSCFCAPYREYRTASVPLPNCRCVLENACKQFNYIPFAECLGGAKTASYMPLTLLFIDNRVSEITAAARSSMHIWHFIFFTYFHVNFYYLLQQSSYCSSWFQWNGLCFNSSNYKMAFFSPFGSFKKWGWTIYVLAKHHKMCKFS
jgi:hypothetical protein